MKTVFCRGMYLAENTSQAPSVELVPQMGDQLCAQETAKTCQKAPQGIFDSLKTACASASSFFMGKCLNRILTPRAKR